LVYHPSVALVNGKFKRYTFKAFRIYGIGHFNGAFGRKICKHNKNLDMWVLLLHLLKGGVCRTVKLSVISYKKGVYPALY